MLAPDVFVEDINSFNLYEIISSIFMNNVVKNNVKYDNIDVIPVNGAGGVDFIGYAYKDGKEVFKRRLKINNDGNVNVLDE